VADSFCPLDEVCLCYVAQVAMVCSNTLAKSVCYWLFVYLKTIFSGIAYFSVAYHSLNVIHFSFFA